LDAEAARKILQKDLANIIQKAKRGQPLTATERRLISENAAAGPRMVDSTAQAAALMNEDPALLKGAKALGCPAFLAGSRVDMARLREIWPEWRARVAAATDDGSLDDQIKRERRDLLRLQRKQLEGSLVDLQEVTNAAAALNVEARAILQSALLQTLPAAAAGEPADKIRELAEELFEQICRRFRAFAERWQIKQENTERKEAN
jgi:hypothetical protein